MVRELSGCQDVFELVRLADPLAPDTAARLRHLTLPPVAELASGLHTLVRGSGVESRYDVVLVEGAGGVAVRLDTTGGTVLNLAAEISAAGHSVEFVVVTSLALGTLNSTELTVQAIRTAGLAAAGLVFGNVPDHLDLAERCNLDELPRVTDLPVLGRIPRGVGSWDPARFRAGCAEWLAGWSA
ncbi:MAG: ATP-dependent dethiobiotin synthetase BioD [Nocardioidaceae bacterium]